MRTLVSLFFITFTFQLFGQKSRNLDTSPNLLSTKVFTLKGTDESGAAKLPFRSIYFRDSRYDTTKIGFYDMNMDGQNGFKKMQFKGGLADGLNKYINNQYSKSFNNSSYELFIDIKKFWITGIKRSTSATREVNGLKHKEKLHLNWEFYLVNNKRYLPVVRIDTLIDINAGFLRNNKTVDVKSRYPDIRYVINKIMEQVNYQVWIENFDNRRQVTLETINNLNDKRLALNIPGGDSIKNGEYVRFADFVNNQPTESNWKGLHKQLNFVEDYKRNLCNSTSLSHYYAFAHDGTIFYNIEHSTKMVRTGNTFEFFKLIPSVSDVRFTLPYATGAGTFNIPFTLKSKNWKWVPMQIDMDTGLPY